MRRFIYPASIEVDTAGFHLVTFPDVPEAGTDAKSREEALEEAPDCLMAALGGYMEAKQAIPPPSKIKRGYVRVSLPILVTAKLALYEAMRTGNVTNVELGRRLGVSEGAVRRLVDLDHRSHIGQIESALAALGQRLVIEIHAA
jgi:antitoxin HicB